MKPDFFYLQKEGVHITSQARGWTFQTPSDRSGCRLPRRRGDDLPDTVGPERLPTLPQARGWTFQAPSDRSGCRLPRRRWTFQTPSDRSGCRLPRRRGDVPFRHRRTGAVADLPRRRGDGPFRHRRTGAVADSPAGAGMDLPDTVGPERLPTPPQARGWTFQTPSDRSGCRLPRRRGDGPSRHRRTGAVADSPAGAGMDLPDTVGPERLPTLPQARGWTFQAPSDRSGCRLSRRRGDGPSRHRRTGAVADSPAGAGMDLPDTVGPERLPTPPQARGWTFQTPSDRSGCRLPRRRGDGPFRHRRTGAVADSPAGAGMDLSDTVRTGAVADSPAGAGMDLPGTVGPERLPTPPQARGWTFQTPSDRSGCRLPRRRGDGPFRHRRTGAVADSPAGAGMDLSGTVGPERLPTPPQARGWTFQTPFGPERLPTPPQARGWTFQTPSDRSGCRLPRRRGDGPSRHRRTGAVADSPAGAGMDLPDTVGPERLPTPPQARGWTFQTPSDRSGCRLPRRRGDGPSRHRRTGAVADSPAGAGMDLSDTVRTGAVADSPAGAGMDLPDTVGPERLPTPPQARGWTFQTPSDRSGCRLPRRRGDGPFRHRRTGAVADSPAGAGMDLPDTVRTGAVADSPGRRGRQGHQAPLPGGKQRPHFTSLVKRGR